jgi:hypothetical protein
MRRFWIVLEDGEAQRAIEHPEGSVMLFKAWTFGTGFPTYKAAYRAMLALRKQLSPLINDLSLSEQSRAKWLKTYESIRTLRIEVAE